MRIGFEDDRNFETILGLIEKHSVDLLSLHARTVKKLTEVRYIMSMFVALGKHSIVLYSPMET